MKFTQMTMDIKYLAHERISEIMAFVGKEQQEHNLSEIKMLTFGNEFIVCSGKLDGKIVAIRTPINRCISNDNDASIDAGQLLLQDEVIAKHLAKYNIPTIIPIRTYISSNMDFAILPFVKHDKSRPPFFNLGRLAKTIHEAPLVDLIPCAQTEASFEQTVAKRLIARLGVLKRKGKIDFEIPKESEVLETLLIGSNKKSILHLDFRPGNLLIYKGDIIGIIDWSNMLVGNPLFELARIAEGEAGLLTAEFLRGYGTDKPFDEIDDDLESLYRLDAAVMLSILFLLEIGQPTIAKRYIRRVNVLADKLRWR